MNEAVIERASDRAQLALAHNFTIHLPLATLRLIFTVIHPLKTAPQWPPLRYPDTVVNLKPPVRPSEEGCESCTLLVQVIIAEQTQ